MKSTLVLIIFSAISFTLFGQNTGTVSFIIQPRTAFMKVDGKLFEISENQVPLELKLSAGKHLLEFWAPTRMKFTDTIDVTVGDTMRYVKLLSLPSAEYLDYQEKRRTYFKQKYSAYALLASDIGLSTGIALGLAFSKNKLDDKQNMMNLFNKAYQNAVTIEEIENRKLGFDRARREYEKSKKQFKTTLFIAVPVVALMNTYTIRNLIKRKKNPLVKPEFIESNPFTNVQIGISPAYAFNGAQFNLSLNF